MTLLFQYGSNTLAERLNSDDRLCGDARDLGLATTIDAFELSFETWSKKEEGYAAANLRANAGRRIIGVLYEVPDYLISRETARPRGRKSMDQIEGSNYERRPIVIEQTNGDQVEALTYLVREPAEGLRTSLKYAGYILQGLRNHNAPEDYIEYVKQRVTANNPALARDIAGL